MDINRKKLTCNFNIEKKINCKSEPKIFEFGYSPAISHF